MKNFFQAFLACLFVLFTTQGFSQNDIVKETDSISLVVLGTIQDAGSPQIACTKDCCSGLFQDPDHSRKVSSLGIIDHSAQKTYLFEATPDIATQMKTLTSLESKNPKEMADGIFLTHAHIGHYAGLMFLGKEAMDADKTPVHVMPRMKNFLENNGPWDQLVKRQNIELQPMQNERPVQLSDKLKVTPLVVPHRDEYSETVGYRITGPQKSALFIPDIDKWDKWEKDINKEIEKVDYAFLDATFFSGKELNNRDISQIPHPFIIESLERFRNLPEEERNKIIFIHFNHTNPVIDPDSDETQSVLQQGFRIARINKRYTL